MRLAGDDSPGWKLLCLAPHQKSVMLMGVPVLDQLWHIRTQVVFLKKKFCHWAYRYCTNYTILVRAYQYCTNLGRFVHADSFQWMISVKWHTGMDQLRVILASTRWQCGPSPLFCLFHLYKYIGSFLFCVQLVSECSKRQLGFWISYKRNFWLGFLARV